MSQSMVEGLRDVPGLRIEHLGLIRVKGRAEPVEVSALHTAAEPDGAVGES